MSLRTQIRYFNFIRKNWSLGLALFTLYHEIRGEKKYRVDTSGHNDLGSLKIHSANKKSGYIYQPVNYYVAEKAFDYVVREVNDPVLTDFGCGKGRILAISAYYGFKDITGVEFAPELCKKAEENLSGIVGYFPGLKYHVFCYDATQYEIRSCENVFTFFNPFNDKVMLPVVKNILSSVKKYPRDIFVIYFNPTEKEIFLSAGFTELWYYSKMEYIDFSILFKEKVE